MFVLHQRAARPPEISDPNFFFGLNLFFEKKAGKTQKRKSFLIKSPPQAENFEDFSFKIVRKCFRNAFVSADFGSGSVKIFRLRRAFLLKK